MIGGTISPKYARHLFVRKPYLSYAEGYSKSNIVGVPRARKKSVLDRPQFAARASLIFVPYFLAIQPAT